MSLGQLAKQYQQSKRNREKVTQSIRNEIDRSIEEITIAALKLQNHKVNHIHKNQQAIEMKLKKQQQLLTEFRNHQDAWVNLYEQLNRALMKAGDLAHYAGYVQAEIKELVGEGTVAQFLQESQKELQEETSSTQLKKEEIKTQDQAVPVPKGEIEEKSNEANDQN